MKKFFKVFFLSVLLFFLGCALLGVFYYIATENRDFFSDPGWRDIGNGTRMRIEGGNLWYLLALAIPFVGGAAACVIGLWHLWKHYIVGRLFFSLIIGLAGLAVGYYWITGFPGVLERLNAWNSITGIFQNIMGMIGYIIIPPSIMIGLWGGAIELFNAND